MVQAFSQISFDDGKDDLRAQMEDAIDRLQRRLDDALETFRNSLAEFDQPEVLDAIAALDQEVGDVISLARQEGGF
ncbi:MAG: hypothetical protein WBA85_05555 [Brucella anthropi]